MMNHEDKMMKYYLDEYCKKLKVDDLLKHKRIKNNNVKEKIKKIIDCIDKISYEEDKPINNYINYWKKNELLKNIGVFGATELDKLWNLEKKGLFEKNRDDYEEINSLCKSSDENGYVDTMFNFFYALKYCIYCFDINLGIKCKKKNIDDIKEELEKYKDEELYKKLEEFALLASQECNVFNYPFNRDVKKIFQQRGLRGIQDQMPKTLYECFCGKFKILFKDLDIKEWLKKENLNCLFEKKYIDVENIKSIGKQTAKEIYVISKKSIEQNKEECINNISEILEIYCSILKERKNS